ncbi:myeloid lymphoid or mixed-lineage leukemia 5 (trithorax, ) [Mortierella polycephala]|uniref:Myeloid lymphoid or mixed-lineage leukemia 5 (Trithorax, ) n=1 Tax=Mortierella polycephala TaxID=41804 RepID=A0A9P6Q711_9FUNG|nr:myeloid lymphoid or mixed-lineage leukemia 5 (trithorax, ) [Mortierella polycephala]
MPLDFAHQLSTSTSEFAVNADVKRSKRQTAGGKQSRQQRENIENAQSTVSSGVSLANLPIQKQSTKIRKRLLTENQANTTVTDHHTSKRRKRLQEDVRHSPLVLSALTSLSNAPRLHRTLSDKSSYLNQTLLSKESDSAKSQSTLASWRKTPQRKIGGTESDDADDEEEQSRANSADASSTSLVLVREPTDTLGVDCLRRPKNGRPPCLINIKFEAQVSSPESQPSPSVVDDLFGSDTTLTSLEDDSEDDSEIGQASNSENVPVTHQDIAKSLSVLPSGFVVPSTMNLPLSAAAAPAVRRGPGRPRKVPLADSTDSGPQPRSRHRKNAGDIAAWSTKVSKSPSPPKPVSVESVLSHNGAPKTPSDSKQAPQPSQLQESLMVRILNAKAPLPRTDIDPDLTNSPDEVVLDASRQGDRKHNDELSDNGPGVMTDKGTDQVPSLCDPRMIETSDSTLLNIPSPTKADGHIFAVPAHPVRRRPTAWVVPHARLSDLFQIPKTTETISITQRLIEKQGRPLLRNYPRPLVLQSCLDIMTQSDSTRYLSNIGAIKTMLKHALQKGMTKMQESAQENAPSLCEIESEEASMQLQSWMAVIGNGDGLLQPSTRKNQEQKRIAERRTLVSDTFRTLNLPPPPEGWDKSSRAIEAGYVFGGDSAASEVDEVAAQRWSSIMKDTLDQLSRLLGCDYCRKTYKTRDELAYHMERCMMARLQTSISSDFDGDSTDSETEDQRRARCPTASHERSPARTSEVSDDEAAVAGEEGIIKCVCGTKDDEGTMVQCDECKAWLHLECLDLSEDDVPDEYFCPTCTGQPLPGNGGKSSRAIKEKSNAAPSRRYRQESMPKLDDNDGASSKYGARRTIEREFESGSESDDVEGTDAEGNNYGVSLEGMVSPQVVLSYDWDQDSQVPGSSDLGYDSEYMSSVLGVSPKRKSIFKEPRAPALMLDGSSSEDIQTDLRDSLLSSDLGFYDDDVVEGFTHGFAHSPSMRLEPGSESDLCFYDGSLESDLSLYDPQLFNNYLATTD